MATLLKQALSATGEALPQAVDFADRYRSQLLQTLASIDVGAVASAAGLLREARDHGRHIFVCGNGGSAATASHFATDMVKSASYNRDVRFKILALVDSFPTLTAYANDVSYDSVFSEQLKNFASPGDVLLAISGSGNSPNVVEAVRYANGAGCQTVALTGRDGGQLGREAQFHLHVKEPHMGRIEDAHMVICHMLCYYFIDNAA